MSKQQRWAMQMDICCQRYAGLGEGGGVDPKKKAKVSNFTLFSNPSLCSSKYFYCQRIR